jgi:hypothetical protein
LAALAMANDSMAQCQIADSWISGLGGAEGVGAPRTDERVGHSSGRAIFHRASDTSAPAMRNAPHTFRSVNGGALAKGDCVDTTVEVVDQAFHFTSIIIRRRVPRVRPSGTPAPRRRPLHCLNARRPRTVGEEALKCGRGGECWPGHGRDELPLRCTD